MKTKEGLTQKESVEKMETSQFSMGKLKDKVPGK
jgi:hypothetical protein